MDGDSIYEEKLERLSGFIKSNDSIVVGAGAGLSTAAGFTYDGARFERYFSDFERIQGFHDMYSGAFYPFSTPEEHWGYWSRFIYVNRYMDPPTDLYRELFELIRNKDYFVITTNVDHCFQKAGVDKERLFYTQGDYGLFQCSVPCTQDTYDNHDAVVSMLYDQGLSISDDGSLFEVAPGTSRYIKSEHVPHCPKCGAPMTMNLRSDGKFVEDDGWHRAATRYEKYLQKHLDMRVLYLELGVGYNTPSIIKYPFWRLTDSNPKASYATVNLDSDLVPEEIKDRSIALKADIAKVIKDLKR